MALVMELFKSLGEIGGELKQENKDTSVVKLLDKTIGMLDKAMKAMDRFLKKKGIDVGKLAEDGKSKSKSFLDNIRTTKSGEKVGLLKGLVEKGKDIKNDLKDRYDKYNESNTAPPDGEKVGIFTKAKAFFKPKEAVSPNQIPEPNPIIEQIKPKETQSLPESAKVSSYGKRVDKLIQERTKRLEARTLPEDKTNIIVPSTDKAEKVAKVSVYERMIDKLNLIADKLNPSDDKDLDGDGIREEDWVEKSDNRAKRRKDEIEAEKKAVQEKGKKKGKGKGGFLSSILDKIGSIGGLISGAVWTATKFLGRGLGRVTWWGVKKIGEGLWGVTRWASTKLLSGMGSLFTRLVPNLSASIAGTLQSLTGKGLWGAAKTIGSTALTLGRAALPYVGTALGVAARGAAMILSGPVGWGIAIGTAAYGLYKLYKYLTRNDIAEDIYGKLHLLRLQTYGFGHNAKENYSKIFELEGLLKENLTFNAQEKKLSISKPTPEQSEKIYELFGVSAEDKERRAIVGNWFSKRFIPAYHAFMQVLYGINTSIYIDDLEKLNTNNIKQFLMLYKVPGAIYSYTYIPYFEQPETTVTKKDIETTLESIKFENNSKLKAVDKPPAERMEGEIAKKKVEEKTKELTRSTLQKAGIKTKIPMNASSTEGPIGVLAASPDAEAPPTGANLLTAHNTGANRPIPKATGPVLPFDGTMVGIRTKLDRAAITNLDPDVLNLFAGMAKEYNNLTGKELHVEEAFRTYEDQAELYRKYGASGRAAKPGRSLHEFGLAIDISGAQARELDKLGLLRKYGFTVPIGGEDWHIEPIGASLDPDKAKHDKSYRKAAILNSVGRGGGGYGFDKGARKYGRNIDLQRKIYESKITETKPEDPSNKQGLELLTANKPETTVTTSSSIGTSVSESANTKATETTPSTNNVGGAVSLSGLMGGQIIKQEPEPTVKTSSSTVDIGSGYANSVASVNPNMNLSKHTSLSPVEAIKQASKMTGVSEETLMTFGKLESSLRSNVSAGTSTAGGLFQFTDTTWAEQLRINGPKYGLSPDTPKTDALANALMAAEYAKANLRNVSGYEEAGISQEVALYLTHHFGPTGGKNLINAYKRNPNAPVQTAVSTEAYTSNKAALAGKTIAGYFQSLDSKFAVAKATPASAYKGSGATAVASTTPSTPSVSTKATTSPSYEENAATNVMASYSPASSVAAPSPTINQAAYDINRIETPAKQTKVEQAPAVTVNTESLELIMSNQLTTLTQIATVLGTINDKLDMDKLLGALGTLSGNQSSPSQPLPRSKQVPHTGVSMSKKIMT